MRELRGQDLRSVDLTAQHRLVKDGRKARLFALIQPFDDISDSTESDLAEPDAELVAYGITLPDGTTATFSVQGQSCGHWANPDRAALRLHSDLVWLDPAE